MLSLIILIVLLSLLLCFTDCQSYFVTDLFPCPHFSYFGQDHFLNLLQTGARGSFSDDARPIKHYLQNLNLGFIKKLHNASIFRGPTSIHTHTPAHARGCMCTHTSIHTCLHTNIHPYTYTYTYAHTHTCAHVHAHMHMRIHTCIQILHASHAHTSFTHTSCFTQYKISTIMNYLHI